MTHTQKTTAQCGICKAPTSKNNLKLLLAKHQMEYIGRKSLHKARFNANRKRLNTQKNYSGGDHLVFFNIFGNIQMTHTNTLLKF